MFKKDLASEIRSHCFTKLLKRTRQGNPMFELKSLKIFLEQIFNFKIILKESYIEKVLEYPKQQPIFRRTERNFIDKKTIVFISM